MYLLRVPSFRIVINPGNHNGGETPDPIPNSEVKPSGADGTAWATAWESRSLPGFFIKLQSICLNYPGLYSSIGLQ